MGGWRGTGCNVRFGSLADIPACLSHVRSTPKRTSLALFDHCSAMANNDASTVPPRWPPIDKLSVFCGEYGQYRGSRG